MAITWTQNNDSLAQLGPSVMVKQTLATFSVSDYVTGGYAVYPAAAFGFSAIRALLPVAFSAAGAGTPGGYLWEAIKPAVGGPAASNPWYLRAFQQNAQSSTSNPFTEVPPGTNFASGNMDFMGFGY